MCPSNDENCPQELFIFSDIITQNLIYLITILFLNQDFEDSDAGKGESNCLWFGIELKKIGNIERGSSLLHS